MEVIQPDITIMIHIILMEMEMKLNIQDQEEDMVELVMITSAKMTHQANMDSLIRTIQQQRNLETRNQKDQSMALLMLMEVCQIRLTLGGINLRRTHLMVCLQEKNMIKLLKI